MYKLEHIRSVARSTRLPQYVVADVLNASHRLIEETLRSGSTVTFPGFGSYVSRQRKEGKAFGHLYPRHRVAAFRPGSILKRAVQGNRRTGRPGGMTGLLTRVVTRGKKRK